MPDSGEPTLAARDTKTGFRTGAGEVYTVNDASFYVRPGERLGVVCGSGSGHSAAQRDGVDHGFGHTGAGKRHHHEKRVVVSWSWVSLRMPERSVWPGLSVNYIGDSPRDMLDLRNRGR
jgi:ABC-type phosphonate transport system ATPase subunit